MLHSTNHIKAVEKHEGRRPVFASAVCHHERKGEDSTVEHQIASIEDLRRFKGK